MDGLTGLSRRNTLPAGNKFSFGSNSSSETKDSSSSSEDKGLKRLVSKLELDKLLRILQLARTEFVETWLDVDRSRF